MPGHDIALELRPPKIQIPVLEPDVFRGFHPVFNGENRGSGLGKNPEFLHQDFDGTGGHFRIDHIRGPGRDFSLNAYDKLVTNGLGFFMDRFGNQRVEHHLSDAIPVPQIDKNHPAMVPAVLDPSHEHHGLVYVRFPKIRTKMGSFHVS